MRQGTQMQCMLFCQMKELARFWNEHSDKKKKTSSYVNIISQGGVTLLVAGNNPFIEKKHNARHSSLRYDNVPDWATGVSLPVLEKIIIKQRGNSFSTMCRVWESRWRIGLFHLLGDVNTNRANKGFSDWGGDVLCFDWVSGYVSGYFTSDDFSHLFPASLLHCASF